jgi:hypothetical protein
MSVYFKSQYYAQELLSFFKIVFSLNALKGGLHNQLPE